ncbi:hypothetical protein RUM44_005984 [Polyplax serrata]|uniref:Uncharacterized protein n=1 Tax=Polyplax serrata TaxID=468196 RepID=A0ABR1B088_POLSC
MTVRSNSVFLLLADRSWEPYQTSCEDKINLLRTDYFTQGLVKRFIRQTLHGGQLVNFVGASRQVAEITIALLVLRPRNEWWLFADESRPVRGSHPTTEKEDRRKAGRRVREFVERGKRLGRGDGDGDGEHRNFYKRTESFY